MVSVRMNLRRRLRRTSAWFACVLLDPRRGAAAAIGAIGLFTIVGWVILTGLKFTQDLFMDSAEAYAWGQQFLGGYGRHPPLTGWLAGIWYSVFPPANWASHAASRLLSALSLFGIFMVARRTMGMRVSALIVLAMMLYPIFVGAKSDRFNAYQVLLAALPLVVWAFLVAYEKCDAVSGVLLGLAAGAAALAIYSAVLPLGGIVIAAIVHPARRRFFASAAPYAAVATFLVVISPHLIWLITRDFSSIRYAANYAQPGVNPANAFPYLGHHLGLLALPLLAIAVALWPLRRSRVAPAGWFTDERLLVTIVMLTMVAIPPIAAPLVNARLKADWGNALFFLVPLVITFGLPVRITRLAVGRIATFTTIFLVIMAVGAPAYAWLNFRLRSAPFDPMSELAVEVTKQWRQRYNSPLPLVVSGFEVAAPIVFYSPDHPKMYADFNPAFSPWIDFPADLKKGYVAVCFADDEPCIRDLRTVGETTDRTEIALAKTIGGRSMKPVKFHVEFVAPSH